MTSTTTTTTTPMRRTNSSPSKGQEQDSTSDYYLPTEMPNNPPPHEKTVVVEVMYECSFCGCQWPDVILDGNPVSYCPNSHKPGHPPLYIAQMHMDRNAIIVKREPSP